MKKFIIFIFWFVISAAIDAQSKSEKAVRLLLKNCGLQ